MKPKLPLLYASGLAVEINADALPEWIQLAPFGEHPTRDGKSVQVFNAEAAASVVGWFNSIWSKIKRVMGINALPIWLGHPDFAPEQWPQKKQLGSITELESRADGLWGRAEWNASAAAEVRDNKHRFASTAWDCDEIAPGRIQPVMLWSVGMWHRPNIKSVQPVCNAVADNDQPETNAETNTMNKNIIAALMAAHILAAETEDEAAVVTAINAHGKAIAGNETQLNAATTELETLRARVTELEARETQLNAEVESRRSELETLRTAHINAILDSAVETGRITQADVETTRTELNANLETGIAKLKDKKPALNTAPLSIGRQRPAIMQAQERITTLNAWVESYIEQHKCDYATAFNASKADDKMKAIHAAMQSADSAAAA